MNDKELKSFIIAFIHKKEKESSNRNYIEYSYYELKVKYGLTEEQIDEVLRVSRDYFENKNYKNDEVERLKIKVKDFIVSQSTKDIDKYSKKFSRLL